MGQIEERYTALKATFRLVELESGMCNETLTAARELTLAAHIGEDMENGCPDCAVGNPCKDRERIEKLGDG